MNLDEIKQEIISQITIINRLFGKNGPLGIKDPMIENIDSLESNLNRIRVFFKIYMIGASILAGILFIVSLLKTFEMLDSIDLNKKGLMILFTIVFGLNAFAYNKIELNLENKIYLLKLLNIMNRE